jgi:hypothetical protein
VRKEHNCFPGEPVLVGVTVRITKRQVVRGFQKSPGEYQVAQGTLVAEPHRARLPAFPGANLHPPRLEVDVGEFDAVELTPAGP